MEVTDWSEEEILRKVEEMARFPLSFYLPMPQNMSNTPQTGRRAEKSSSSTDAVMVVLDFQGSLAIVDFLNACDKKYLCRTEDENLSYELGEPTKRQYYKSRS